MKNRINFFIVTFILSILIWGCKKDDNNEPTLDNYLKYGDTKYGLSVGFLENYGQTGDGVYNLDLTLLSAGINIHENNGMVDSISGSGHGVYFEIFTTQPDKLDIGTYQFDPVGIGNASTFDYGGGVLNFDSETQEGLEFVFSNGSLTVTENGSQYEITFDNGANVSGHYKGSIQYYNYDNQANSMAFKSGSILK